MNNLIKHEEATDEIATMYRRIIDIGVCDLCHNDAPFRDPTGTPYLLKYLLRKKNLGGTDTPDNVVFLCPNCFQKMVVFPQQEDYNKLVQSIKNRSCVE